MTTTIRRATRSDAATLASVAAATFALACPPHTRQESIAAFIAEVLSVESFEGYLAEPTRLVLIAEAGSPDSGSPVAIGYAMLVMAEPTDADVVRAVTMRPTAELSKIYVLPDRHGSGAARALLDSAVDAAAESGATGVWLGVNQLNERAQRFYRRCGFQVVGTKHFDVGGQREDDYVMEKSLLALVGPEC